ncbi:DUF6578 domain-containing protein [Allokutzneria oryzae]|uniref:DUF6578 domain-containing protein n=1 Tax=Allokutzneria oryzae TaxID=1378989 RepID=A0ABV6A7X7_9PSEU
MAVIPVVVEDWQQQCCGDAFAIGDRVSWQLRYGEGSRELLQPAERVRLSLGAEPIPDSDGAHLSSGELHVFWSEPTAKNGLAEVVGVLTEERHDNFGIPPTVGYVRRIRRLAMEHRREFGTRVWHQQPGTETFVEAWGSEAEVDTRADAPADADVARRDVGLLVDLEVSLG